MIFSAIFIYHWMSKRTVGNFQVENKLEFSKLKISWSFPTQRNAPTHFDVCRNFASSWWFDRKATNEESTWAKNREQATLEHPASEISKDGPFTDARSDRCENVSISGTGNISLPTRLHRKIPLYLISSRVFPSVISPGGWWVRLLWAVPAHQKMHSDEWQQISRPSMATFFYQPMLRKANIVDLRHLTLLISDQRWSVDIE